MKFDSLIGGCIVKVVINGHQYAYVNPISKRSSFLVDLMTNTKELLHEINYLNNK